ncbi:right-handed parallel beta-helix repeat-containing protein [Gimesia maris]|uniref:right-handed parallel beta-helix repeat-containing protein n=1 Tax=Gimesia maris TaxID=122 RepID=UPI0032EF107D
MQRTFLNHSSLYCQSAVVILLVCNVVAARDIHVDPDKGNDAATEGPLKTIRQAIRIAEPGDTIHLLPTVYHEYAGFYGKQGTPEKPITLDGHGATLEGSDPIDVTQWSEVKPDLYRCENLMPALSDAILQRWFFLWNGKMVHMGRTSKGPSKDFKNPEDLQPGEWTFVKQTAPTGQTERAEKSSQVTGAFYLKLSAGAQLSEQNLRVPVRSAGVQFGGSGKNHNAHLVIRNLTCTHPYNDGFNIHGHCENVLFENIRAIECGDDGISAHETAEYRVDGFVSIGNSTGICDTGASRTSYNRVFIRDCLGFDLFFLDTGRYTLTNSVIFSSAVRTLTLVGRDDPDQPCSLTMKNVFIRRVAGKNEVRVSRNSRLDASHVTLMGLNFQATGGEVSLFDSLIVGAAAPTNSHAAYDYLAASADREDELNPELLIWKDVKWKADRNCYELQSLRVDKTFFTPTQFGQFQQLTGQEQQSKWVSSVIAETGCGADLAKLKQSTIPENELETLRVRTLLP